MSGLDFVRQHALVLVETLAVCGLFAWVALRALSRLFARGVRLARARRALGESGAVFAEFLITIFPFLIMFFGLMQLSLASMARLLVNYAAFAAARAAIVVMPNGDAQEGVNVIGDGLDRTEDYVKSQKAVLMRNAASFALIPASPSIDVIASDVSQGWSAHVSAQASGSIGGAVTGNVFATLLQNELDMLATGSLQKFHADLQASLSVSVTHQEGTDPAAMDRALDAGLGAKMGGPAGALLRSLRKLVYARVGTAVTLHDAQGRLKTRFDWNEPITARVSYLYYCQVPLANRIAGRRFRDLPQAALATLATTPLRSVMDVGIPGRFMVLTAEHTLVNQGKPL